MDVDRKPDLVGIEEVEAPRHDPDDRVRLIVEQDALAKDTLTAAKGAPPECLADDGDTHASRAAVARSEVAPETRLDAEHGEETERHRETLNPLRRHGSAEIHLTGSIGFEPFEDRRLRLPTGDLLRGERVPSA